MDYSVAKFGEVEKKDAPTVLLRKTIMNLNGIPRLERTPHLCFSFHTIRIRTVPISFVALYKISDPTSIISDRMKAVKGDVILLADFFNITRRL